MTISTINQSIQFIAWLIAIIELIFALYVLVLNTWHQANRRASILLFIVATNTFVAGWMVGVDNPVRAQAPALLLAMTSPAIQPLFLLTTIAILKPELMVGRKRWIIWLVHVFILIIAALTLYDQLTTNRYWFSGLPSDYTNGFIPLAQFTQGLISDYIRWGVFTLLPALTILLLLYFAILDKHVLRGNRRLAWLLLIAEGTFFIARIFSLPLIPAAAEIGLNTLLIAAFGYAVLKQIISERRIQRGSLQARLMASIMVVSLPLLIAVTVFVNWRASTLIRLATNTQNSEIELIAQTVLFQRWSLISLAIGALLLFFMSWLTIRHGTRLIEDLADTANGVASGDLTRVAIIQSEDELGALARAFNSMITQARESITNLERRVVERNREIERRDSQLKLSAEIAIQSASGIDLDQLMHRMVCSISDCFNLYHTGIFLINGEGDHIVLRAATSLGGRQMLERNYKLPIDQTSIVGYVAERGEILTSQDVDKITPLSNQVNQPQTQLEIALPLKVRERLLGVLDIHSNKGSAFSYEDIGTLQILSDQIAIAIDHANLQTKNETLSRELGLLYQQQVYRSWQRRLDVQEMTFAYRSGMVTKEFLPSVIEENEIQSDFLLKLPILLRDQPIGWITLRRNPDAQPWSQDEIDLVKETLPQIALALENARLSDENQQRAKNETLVSNITGKTQGLLDVESVMKTAVREIGRSLELSRVQISLSPEAPATKME